MMIQYCDNPFTRVPIQFALERETDEEILLLAYDSWIPAQCEDISDTYYGNDTRKGWTMMKVGFR